MYCTVLYLVRIVLVLHGTMTAREGQQVTEQSTKNLIGTNTNIGWKGWALLQVSSS